MDTQIEVRNLNFKFKGYDTNFFENFSWKLERNSWNCLLGQSGCGKTTLLKIIAGLELDGHISSGDIFFGKNTKGSASLVSYMAQKDLLFPWLTVLQNVCLGEYLKNRRISAQYKKKGLLILEQLGIEKHSKSLPHQLSGGQRQRVAIARTLIQDKNIVLMDEPFASIDAVTRYQLQSLVCKMLKNKTVLWVTHDPQEALRISEHIFIVHGQPAQVREFDGSLTTPIPRNIDDDLLKSQKDLIDCIANENPHNNMNKA